MIVMMMASTPSLNASSRLDLTAPPFSFRYLDPASNVCSGVQVDPDRSQEEQNHLDRGRDADVPDTQKPKQVAHGAGDVERAASIGSQDLGTPTLIELAKPKLDRVRSAAVYEDDGRLLVGHGVLLVSSVSPPAETAQPRNL
ncbi:hypothetical protein [Micromonospora sp. A200]|uniref:hypothetical protein n=1 Tax=Micromonospora sp. A200 TaxID=2940568 RepID=UPI0024757794|nr:hypothetical protein [Micromonospora sp. A200]